MVENSAPITVDHRSFLGCYAFRFDTDNNMSNDDGVKAARYIASNLKQQEYGDKSGKLGIGKIFLFCGPYFNQNSRLFYNLFGKEKSRNTLKGGAGF